MKRRTIAADLAAADAAYDAAVEAAAARVRAEHVIPFCDRHRMEFKAGMGTWTFHDDTRGAQIGAGYSVADKGSRLELPKRLLAALDLEVYTGQQSLGSLVADYSPGAQA